MRLQSPATEGVIGYCLSPADLAVSKLAAGRDKDIAFVSVLLMHQYARLEDISGLAATLPPNRSKIVVQNLMIAASRKTK